MTSKELREGNYLQREGHWLKIEVEHIEHVREGNVHNFQPIELTTEILEKLPEDLYESGFAVNFIEGEYWIDGECCKEGYKGIATVKYLHELQNAFLDLAKYELQIKDL